MPSEKSYRHCPVHGYNSPHVETRHGLKCLRCIHERRRARKAKDWLQTITAKARP